MNKINNLNKIYINKYHNFQEIVERKNLKKILILAAKDSKFKTKKYNNNSNKKKIKLK
jgi:hypothetical protein